MMEALLGKLGIEAGLKLGKGVIVALLVAGLFAAGGLGFWRGMETIERMVLASATAAKDTADAQWKAEIEKSNAEVARTEAAGAVAAMKLSAETEQKISGLRTALAEQEKRNAAKPDGQCLDPGSVNELNGLRRRR